MGGTHDKGGGVGKGDCEGHWRDLWYAAMNDVNRVKIGDVFDVETGSTPSTAVSEYWKDGKIKWITPFDLGRLTSNYIYQT